MEVPITAQSTVSRYSSDGHTFLVRRGAEGDAEEFDGQGPAMERAKERSLRPGPPIHVEREDGCVHILVRGGEVIQFRFDPERRRSRPNR